MGLTEVASLVVAAIVAATSSLAVYFRSKAKKSEAKAEQAQRWAEATEQLVKTSKETQAKVHQARKNTKETLDENSSRPTGKRPTGSFRR